MPQVVLRPFAKTPTWNPLKFAEEWRVVGQGAITDQLYTPEMFAQRLDALNAEFATYTTRINKSIFLQVHLPGVVIVVGCVVSTIVFVARSNHLYGYRYGGWEAHVGFTMLVALVLGAILVTNAARLRRRVQQDFIETINYMNVRDEVYEVHWSYIPKQNQALLCAQGDQKSRFGSVVVHRGPRAPLRTVPVIIRRF
ncbi:hypothetical protein ACHHYP_20468 [Achlya hypogyna]|uniref:Transmembrane protein n=1 Tax=Achlya hypogyna TaxID=1202772 RepID=A0A1V9YLR6_ACHHY|nr:hypothetical protein ACHHYP_20468 [Achlya hypogyna]